MAPHEFIQAVAAVHFPALDPLVAWIFGILQAIIVTLLGAGLRMLRSMARNLDAVTAELASLKQEIYGPNQRNGLRGDVSGLKRGHYRHDRELEVLCRENAIERVVDP